MPKRIRPKRQRPNSTPRHLLRLARLLHGRAGGPVSSQKLKEAQPERFFARVRCFDFSCPRCGRITATSPHNDPAGRPLPSQPRALGWNPILRRPDYLGRRPWTLMEKRFTPKD